MLWLLYSFIFSSSRTVLVFLPWEHLFCYPEPIQETYQCSLVQKPLNIGKSFTCREVQKLQECSGQEWAITKKLLLVRWENTAKHKSLASSKLCGCGEPHGKKTTMPRRGFSVIPAHLAGSHGSRIPQQVPLLSACQRHRQPKRFLLKSL